MKLTEKQTAKKIKTFLKDFEDVKDFEVEETFNTFKIVVDENNKKKEALKILE